MSGNDWTLMFSESNRTKNADQISRRIYKFMSEEFRDTDPLEFTTAVIEYVSYISAFFSYLSEEQKARDLGTEADYAHGKAVMMQAFEESYDLALEHVKEKDRQSKEG